MPSLGVGAANFWEAGSAGELSVPAPASVLLRRKGRTATPAIDEPPRTGARGYHLGPARAPRRQPRPLGRSGRHGP
ncbi:polysaccharide lyase beta-sandwich domain-containing protein [Streptomyces sp. NPDC055134]